MPDPDPYLRVGLTPSTDILLAPSAATGGGATTYLTLTATVTGSATVAKTLVFARTLTATVTGTPAASLGLTLTRTFAVDATGVAEVTLLVTPEAPPSIGGTGGSYRQPPVGRPLTRHPVPAREPRRHTITVHATVRARVLVTFTVARPGTRRRVEDEELLLFGVLV